MGEVSVLGGGHFGANFFHEVCDEVFHEVFGLVLLGYSEQKNFSKSSALNSHDSAQQDWTNFRKNFMTRFCRGSLGKNCPQFSQRILSVNFSCKMFSLVSPGLGPQTNSRPKLSAFLSNLRFLNHTVFFTPIFSQSPDLPRDHGLAPSETMV